MDLLPSGTADERELIEIETDLFSLYIKGKPYHSRYESLKQYKAIQPNESMYFSATGEAVESVRVFDVNEEKLVDHTTVPPLFFENGVYQLVVTPKSHASLEFEHEHPAIRNAVSRVGKHPHQLLMGNLSFTNEVGYTTFSILREGKKQLEVTLEVFPSKLSYKQDYQQLLEEVNEEVYNLAYHFVKKTYLGATTTHTADSSWTEFYRLVMKYFQQFAKAVSQIENQPHHQLKREHRLVRGDQLKRQDTAGLKYLRKRPGLFVESTNGMPIHEKKMLPTKGINVQKDQTYDTLENCFVKWMMVRLSHKMNSLRRKLEEGRTLYQQNPHNDKIKLVKDIESSLQRKLASSFWREIGKLDRSVMTLVLQMAPGYREAYQTYLTLSRGLVLHGELARMSVKDVSTLYEYWTFLKLGQILASKYKMISQDIIKVKRDGLFVTLNQSKAAKRVFRHPHTNEKITLHFQKHSGKLPTVRQKPDSMLSIEKVGKDHTYEYVFDAKYRVDFAAEGSYYGRTYGSPGPLEEDINTMHRYRDAIVESKASNYERTTFGAYVLFPWGGEHEYEKHSFYKSIQKVNIGGFPFLPQSTALVERFLDRLIECSPKQLQEEGILPKGTLEEWSSRIEEKVLIVKVDSEQQLRNINQTGHMFIPDSYFCKGWKEANYIALYKPKTIFEDEGGISQYAKISDSVVDYEQSGISLYMDAWERLKHSIKPVGYGISTSTLTTLSNLKASKELPQLYMKNSREKQVWLVLRRFSREIRVELDHKDMDSVRKVKSFQSLTNGLTVEVHESVVKVRSDKSELSFSYEDVMHSVNKVFRQIVNILSIHD
ncbi:restriction endonuclease-like protein [Halobacillus massiliensis]|uniref:restriction endonuclease-like protein n=1 Tax=Halobacillus massiliensis TaxID=1926286 RepID=UPI0009E43A4D|nr:restriction endonuclease-like protein [Halobacillus massiliensis]